MFKVTYVIELLIKLVMSPFKRVNSLITNISNVTV